MGIIDIFKKQIRKPNLVFPQVIKDSEFIKSMDSAFQNRNAYWISVLYKKASKDEDILQAQEIVNSGLREKRYLNADDLELIINITKAYKECNEKYAIFESIGNLMFICELTDELKKKKRISRKIKIACLLWLYQNMIEITLAHLSELFYMIAVKRNDHKFLKMYEQATEKEEHLMMGQLLDYAKSKENQFTSENKDTLLHNSDLRNRLAHANCFYDSVRREIILKNNIKLGIKDFKKEFVRVRDFLNELIFQINDGKYFDMKKDMLRVAHKYFKISRDPVAMTVFRNKIDLES